MRSFVRQGVFDMNTEINKLYIDYQKFLDNTRHRCHMSGLSKWPGIKLLSLVTFNKEIYVPNANHPCFLGEALQLTYELTRSSGAPLTTGEKLSLSYSGQRK